MTNTSVLSNDNLQAAVIEVEKQEYKFFIYDDLLGVIKRGGKRMPLNKEYSPKEFWESMGEKFYRAFDKPEKCSFGVDFFLDRMKEFLPLENALEVGCGFGRIAPFLLQADVIKKYSGVDISEKILKCSKLYLDPSVSEEVDAKSLQAFLSNGNLSDGGKQLVSVELNKVIDLLKTRSVEKSKKAKQDFTDKISLDLGDARKLGFDSSSFDCVISNETIQHLNPSDSVDACREMVRVSKKCIILLERWAFPGEHSEPHIWSHNYSQIFNDLGTEVTQVTTIAQGLQGVVVRKR